MHIHTHTTINISTPWLVENLAINFHYIHIGSAIDEMKNNDAPRMSDYLLNTQKVINRPGVYFIWN